MKGYQLKDRKKPNQVRPLILMLIIVLFVVSIIILSFSKKNGQAKESFKVTLISSLYSNIMESSSSIISYQTNKKNPAFPLPFNIARGFSNIHLYVSANSQVPQNIHHDSKETLNGLYNPKKKVSNDDNTIIKGMLTKEYILTNGAIINGDEFEDYIEAGSSQNNNAQELPVYIMEGAIDYNEFDMGYQGKLGAVETMRSYNGTPFTLEQLKDVSFLVNNFYNVAGGVSIPDELFNSEVMLERDMTIKTANDKPQILIYHTHSQEEFLDSRIGEVEDTVVGMGDYLTQILEDNYGYNVIHVREVFDLIDGKLDRNLAYNYARKTISKKLDENPSVEVVIDLHRDGVAKRSTFIKGQETAQIMLFNGLSRNQKGPLPNHENPNLQDNLAFSLQLQLKSLELYPQLFYKNYLEVYRYNLDLRPKSILIELGTHKNTLKSARNAMEPFAEILDAVLQGN